MKCKRPFYLEDRALLVPCGKCTYCRIAKRREWTLRMLHEILFHKSSTFVTLTYDDDNLPVQSVRPVNYPVLPSLSVSDLQKFFKRLRKRVPDRFRYFACGEYGEQTFRPHYHFIIFGFDGFAYPIKNYFGEPYAVEGNPLFDAWGKGLVHVGFAEPDSIAYVAQYIDKKRYGEAQTFEHYQFRDPEFQLQSLGIGAKFLDSNAGEILRDAALYRYTKEIGLPRYYQKRIKLNTEVRALDYEVYAKKTAQRIEQSQIDLSQALVPEANGVGYREMSDEDFRNYCVGLLNRNKVINDNLVAKGKIKKLRSESL